MDYVSTRNKERKVSAAYAIANGIAPDGGLYCPTAFPTLTDADWKTLAESDYKGRSALILGKFLTDFTAEELADFAAKAYADEKFGGADTAPVVKLSEGKNLLELWHGPTCAFKDMALQMLPHLLTASLRKTGETRTACILVATSGDTGKAALDGFHDVPGTKIMVYYPVDGVSPMQKLQMATQEGANVEVIAIHGNFDDAQSAVKRIFTDDETRAQLDRDGMMLSSANSINWGRLAPQIAYYVSAYCDMVKAGTIRQGDRINVCVPTGNFGNIFAAYIAKRMGLPIGTLVCASNKNNILTDFLNTGVYDRNRTFYTTMSPSMDILISSNLERLLYLIAGPEKTASYMKQLSETGRYEVEKDVLDEIQKNFRAYFCDEEKCASTIRGMFRKYSYVLDPHTSVAVYAAERFITDYQTGFKNIVASTASPYKFAADVMRSLDRDVTGLADKDVLEALSDYSKTEIPAPLASLFTKKVRFTDSIEKDTASMEKAVLNA